MVPAALPSRRPAHGRQLDGISHREAWASSFLAIFRPGDRLELRPDPPLHEGSRRYL